MPSLAQIHLPVLPLPSHYRPHAIYNFCAALHALLLEIEPRNRTDSPSAERWALMQKLPGNASSSNPGEWFTAAADIRMTEDALRKMKKDGKEVLGTLLETFAARGDKFGERDTSTEDEQSLTTLRIGESCHSSKCCCC